MKRLGFSMASKSKYPVKLGGEIAWIYPDTNFYGPVNVGRAFFRSADEIVIGCVSQHAEYTVRLRRTGNSCFEGDFDKGNQKSFGHASCRIYSNEEGHVLIGKWVEDGSDYYFWAELNRVEPSLAN